MYSAVYILGVTGKFGFIEALGIIGFILWISSVATIAISFVAELCGEDYRLKLCATLCFVISILSNFGFIIAFMRAAGLGIV